MYKNTSNLSLIKGSIFKLMRNDFYAYFSMNTSSMTCCCIYLEQAFKLITRQAIGKVKYKNILLKIGRK